ncbi:hypothetical protein [Pseudodesulfovibrio tunisiensis]|uniref:hypothetical protein n=1 Tax=Pseudodesulfovibrio tunisiensis TaxID=463192 RepID=UPI001FB39EF4|nr:hypothetical protein [Pseudodesulfovibrio tunisiensis]
MGGEVAAIATLVGTVASMNSGGRGSSQADAAARERAEREAALERKEADERRRKRDKVREGREAERHRKEKARRRDSLLATGAQGLGEPAKVRQPGLKNRLGE